MQEAPLKGVPFAPRPPLSWGLIRTFIQQMWECALYPGSRALCLREEGGLARDLHH